MLTGALAGALKVSAVALTAGGLATGVYFAVQAGQDSGNEGAQTLETPAHTSSALSPPNQVVAPTPQPTASPTYLLEPSPTAPTGVDTSDWKTYVSPDGFSFKYPPDWTLAENPPGGYRVRLDNPILLEHLENLRAEGMTETEFGAVPGMARFTIGLGSAPFDSTFLMQNCRETANLFVRDDPPNEATATTFSGRPAVRCGGVDLWRAAPGQSEETLEATGPGTYWVEFPPRHTMVVSAFAIAASPDDLATLGAMLSSFTMTLPE
jgi:hypothetical protein